LKRELLQTVDSVSTLRVLLTKWQNKEVWTFADSHHTTVN
jgi:hypothetical protein